MYSDPAEVNEVKLRGQPLQTFHLVLDLYLTLQIYNPLQTDTTLHMYGKYNRQKRQTKEILQNFPNRFTVVRL